jgi:glycerate kinase
MNWTCDQIPLADGGEGTLDAAPGDLRTARVTGPLGTPVDAQWRFTAGSDANPPTAVIEMSRAAGRALLPKPQGDDSVRASTIGVGELILEAVNAGAQRIVVAVGGSATTDGGEGAVSVIETPGRLGIAKLVVACDVRTEFRDAADQFGPQKGATPTQVVELQERLDRLAERYQRDFGVDVRHLRGSGAAGGLAGGLAALGAELCPGFDLVADMVGLRDRLASADAVVTGEGRIDRGSFEGKVVGGVLDLVGNRHPVLCVGGQVEPAVREHPALNHPGVGVVDLADRFGMGRATRDTMSLVAAVVTQWLEHLESAPPGTS